MNTIPVPIAPEPTGPITVTFRRLSELVAGEWVTR
jgi:hypothetical protein